jgi:hypothetical protein
MSRRIFIALTLVSLASAGAEAQDAHFWSQHYATRGVLLGGAVIGSADDLGATFYNPGLMAWVNEREVLLGSNVYEYSSVRAKDEEDSDLDITSQRLTVLPNLVAGQLGRQLFGGHIAYSLLTRQNVQVSAKVRAVDPGPPSTSRLGSGEYFFDQNLTEVWAGVTWARHLGDGWGVGVSPYVAYRGQNLREQGLGQIAEPAGAVSTALVLRDVQYSHWRLLAKAGLGYRADTWSFGFTATTPGLKLWGNGESYLNVSASNLDLDGDSIPDQVLASTFQKDLDAEYRGPWSVGTGGSVTLGRSTIHASAEWFSAVAEYDVLALEPFSSQTSGVEIRPQVRQGLRSIVNWGAGLEFAVNEERRLYMSLVSDRSAKGSRSGTSALISTWDILHATVGSNVDVGIADLTLGLSYAWGDDEIGTVSAPDDVRDPSEAIGASDSSEIQFRRIRLLVGVQASF